MICVYCKAEYDPSVGSLLCPVCEKEQSAPRLFLAAEAGESDAMYLLSLCVREDAAFSRALLAHAAAKGSFSAAMEYARCLIAGDGCERDPAGAKAILQPYKKRQGVSALLLRAGLFVAPRTPALPPLPEDRLPLYRRFAAEAETARDYETALRLLRYLAERGDAPSEERLGDYFAEGIAGERDGAEARRQYVAACRDGSVSAYVKLGDGLRDGTLSESPEGEAALACYRRAAELGSADALCRLGDAAMEGVLCEESIPDALRCYREAAELGSAYGAERAEEMTAALDESYRRAVAIHERGEEARAAGIFLSLAQLGHAKAANRYGYACQRGLGVPVSRREAARWYAIGAENGSLYALYNLGVCYAEGIGVAFDYRRAVELLRAADAHGIKAASPLLEKLRARRRRSGARQIYSLATVVYRRGEFRSAFRLLETAAELGCREAAYRLSLHYRYGDGTEVDPIKAEVWETRALDGGYVDRKRLKLGYLRARREQELLGRITD